MPPDLTISIVSADNLALLLPCLHSIFDHTHHIELEVFVVDNASTDSTAAIVEQKFPSVRVLRNSARMGFSTNNNQVLRLGSGRHLMLLNDDTVILDSALDRMVAYMDQHPEAGAVGGFLLNPDRSPQPAFASFPHPLLEGLLPATVWSACLMPTTMEPFTVDSVCGAAMLVRRKIVEQVGLLDAMFDPIYSEEIDWCYRIKHAGWVLYLLPQAQIIHYGSQTMNRAVPRKYELLLSHKALFFRKHMGRSAVISYQAGLTLSTFMKFLSWFLLSLLFSNNLHYQEKRDLHHHILMRIASF